MLVAKVQKLSKLPVPTRVLQRVYCELGISGRRENLNKIILSYNYAEKGIVVGKSQTRIPERPTVYM